MDVRSSGRLPPPPPAYNFAFTPRVHDNDTWADMKKNGYLRPQDGFIPIHMPKNTGAGFVIAALCAVLGFALIWHMWLPAAGRLRRDARRCDPPYLQLQA